MARHFIVADTHFGHHNILKFEPDIFPQKNIDERDEMLIRLWNETVAPDDKVWHLGDVAFNTRLPLLHRLNGKRELLLMGNHEHKNIREYLPYFEDIKAMAELGGVIFSHYPVHPQQFTRYRANVHGHLHRHKIMKPGYTQGSKDATDPDPRYVCVCIEQTGLKPIAVETIMQRIHDGGL